MELTAVALAGFGGTPVPRGPLSSKGVVPARRTHSHVFTWCSDASPAAISNNGNYNDLRLKQGNSGLKADCNEVVRGKGREGASGEGTMGHFRALGGFV